MAAVTDYAGIVEQVLDQYTKIPYAHGKLTCEAIFDRPRGRFILITLGWDDDERVHHPLVHIDIIDGKNGGFLSPSCTPGRQPPQGFCYDTRLPGNGNSGHSFGTTLPAAEKEDLVAYLLTF